jgi:DNA invertase Pin-like site-specific DNA recombinase
MDHFARKAAQSFEDRVVAEIADACPGAIAEMGEEALREHVRAGMAKAARHGIVMEPDAARFILMMLALGPNADEEIDWVRAIVNDHRLDGEGKVRLLEETARKQLRGGEEESA